MIIVRKALIGWSPEYLRDRKFTEGSFMVWVHDTSQLPVPECDMPIWSKMQRTTWRDVPCDSAYTAGCDWVTHNIPSSARRYPQHEHVTCTKPASFPILFMATTVYNAVTTRQAVRTPGRGVAMFVDRHRSPSYAHCGGHYFLAVVG